MANPKNVIWETGTNTQGGETLTSANILKAEESQFYLYKTDGATNELPDVPDKRGVLNYFTYRVQNSGGYSTGRFGRQHWISFTGEIWTRSYQNVSGSEKWGQWKKLGTDINIENFFIKPEKQSKRITNLDELKSSGMYRTDGQNAVASSFPSDMGNKWATVLVIVENSVEDANNDACTQMLFGMHENDKGKIYLRSLSGQSWSSWVKLGAGTAPAGNYWDIPTETLQDVNGSHDTGYYFTAPNATGMEGVPQDKRDGIVKIIKDEAGGVSIQEYTSSVQGDNNVYVRTIPINNPQTRTLSQQFQKITDTDAKTKIFDTRDLAVGLPATYLAKSGDKGSDEGYIYHEWKATSANGLDLPVELQGERCILTTYVPYEKDEQVRNDYSDIVQIAFVKDGKITRRNGSSLDDAWGSWSVVGQAGGGTAKPYDLAKGLEAEIKAWGGQETQSHPAQKEFRRWFRNANASKLKTWLAGASTEDMTAEKQAFDNYVDSRITSREGINFNEWIYH